MANLTNDKRDEDAWDWTIAEIKANPQGALEYIRRLELKLTQRKIYNSVVHKPHCPCHPDIDIYICNESL